jgi:hypothetical protein
MSILLMVSMFVIPRAGGFILKSSCHRMPLTAVSVLPRFFSSRQNNKPRTNPQFDKKAETERELNYDLTSSEQLPFIWGTGDWAGHEAKYDVDTGTLVRVEEHLLPPAMVEWGGE